MRRMMRIVVSVLVLVLIAGGGSAANAQSYITADDLKIAALPDIEINKQISLTQACKLLGQPEYYCIEYGGAWTGWHAVFPDVELWVLGPTDKKTPGIIVRVFISRPGCSTSRGISIDDTQGKFLSLYGDPGLSTTANGLTWHTYFIRNTLQRILFGVDQLGTISKIGYSLTAGGL